jgi:hypothetical protein
LLNNPGIRTSNVYGIRPARERPAVRRVGETVGRAPPEKESA